MEDLPKVNICSLEQAFTKVIQEYIKVEGVLPQKILLVAEGCSQSLSAKQTVSLSVMEIPSNRGKS